MEKVYKYLSVVLVAVILVGGGFYLVEEKAHSNTRRTLTNEVARLEGTIRETETVSSRRAQEVKGLKSRNKDLQKIIKSRNEKIAALTEANIRLKDKVFTLESKEKIIDKDGNEIELDALCRACIADKRFRVDFSQRDDPYLIEGFTLTNPPHAEVALKWTRDLHLDIVLTRDKSGNFRVYLDSRSGDVVPTELKLRIDPSAFTYRWYQKISTGGVLGLGERQGLLGLSLQYDFTEALSAGPQVIWAYDGQQRDNIYGVSIRWYPFRR